MSGALSRLRWHHPSLALAAPALLLALGIWQITRVAGAADDFAARAGRIQATEDRLRPIAARDPTSAIRFDNNPRTYTAAEALARLDEVRTELDRDALIEQARYISAWIATFCGAIGTLCTLSGLVAIWLCARRGMRSRPALVGAFGVMVRLLPPILGGVAVGTALAFVGAILFEVGGAWFFDSINTGEIKLILLGLGFAALGLYYAFDSVRQLRRTLRTFTPQPMQVLGRHVTHAEAPGLWAYLNDLAARQGAHVPDNIVLGLTEGFFVTQSRIRLMPEESVLEGSSLYLSAPMLPLLSRAETTAIIAHELAHFTGEDTRYSQHFLPLYASMGRSMEAVSQRSRSRSKFDGALQPAATIARHAIESFQRVVSHWSRLREFEADRASLDVGAGRAAGTALVRTGMAAALVGGTLEDIYAHPSHAQNDVVAAVMRSAASSGFTDPHRHLEDRQPHPTDSHPPTRQRIEALGVTIDDAFLAEASRPLQPEDTVVAHSLFADWPGLRQSLGADFIALAAAHDREVLTALEEAASLTPAEDVPVHERALIPIVTFASVAALFLGGALFLVWLAAAGTGASRDDQVIWLTAAGSAVFGLVFAAAAHVRRRRLRSGPFLVLGALGFRCIGISGLVPWSDIRSIHVMTGQAFITTFVLEPGATIPEQIGQRWSVKLDAKNRQLRLKGYVPRGMKPQAYLDLLMRAWRAYQAQAMLRARESDQC